jgi:hypothetical protein
MSLNDIRKVVILKIFLEFLLCHHDQNVGNGMKHELQNLKGRIILNINIILLF